MIPDRQGRFGPFGGRFVPETLMSCLEELEEAFRKARGSASFRKELAEQLRLYAGRPTPLYFAKNLTKSRL